ncbi:MAG: hypothetical protein WC459_03495 [Patescibacteria group bacterium]
MILAPHTVELLAYLIPYQLLVFGAKPQLCAATIFFLAFAGTFTFIYVQKKRIKKVGTPPVAEGDSLPLASEPTQQSWGLMVEIEADFADAYPRILRDLYWVIAPNPLVMEGEDEEYEDFYHEIMNLTEEIVDSLQLKEITKEDQEIGFFRSQGEQWVSHLCRN